MRWSEVIEAFHAGPCRCVLTATGGGATAFGELLSVPGGSATILEAVIPYASAALDAWLGKAPEQYCSKDTALKMAARAFQKALQLAPPKAGEIPLGLGCTASLASARPKQGPHRAYLAVQTPAQALSVHLELDKGGRTRAAEETVIADAILRLLAEISGLGDLPESPLTPRDRIEHRAISEEPLLRELLLHQRPLAWSLPDGRLVSDVARRPAGLLCGSFDPLHHGHEALRAVAENRLGGPVWYELSVYNVDKPPLDSFTIRKRREQFMVAGTLRVPSAERRSTDARADGTRTVPATFAGLPLALTDAPTFVEKAVLLPNTVFVVGMDTAERIVQAKYYPGGAMTGAFDGIRAHGCGFLVAARVENGTLRQLSDLTLPPAAAGLFEAIPVDEFREDISSTELRRKGHA